MDYLIDSVGFICGGKEGEEGRRRQGKRKRVLEGIGEEEWRRRGKEKKGKKIGTKALRLKEG